MKKIFSIMLIAFLVLGLGACAPSEDDEPTFKIGFAASTFTNPFFNDIEDGIKSVLAGTDYELVSLGADNDASKQAAQIEDLIAQKVDLILLNPVDSTTVGTKILEANAAGIPVITVDRSADSGEVVAHVASDNVLGGKMAGEFLKTFYAEGFKVLELLGQPGASAATDRSKGFQEVFGAALINQSVTANWSRAEGQSVTEAFLAAQGNPAKVLVFAANDEMALGAVQALKASTAVTEFKVVGFDAIPDALASVTAGDMVATVAQQPFEIGVKAAQAALDFLDGKTVAKNIPVELALIEE
ncbi:MAG: substrate-binding domain-containing protein [Erysipelotrichaceae bacterium]|nr:substrate-binding domain-containing protein [Erysipelotrichaceae bacterium]